MFRLLIYFIAFLVLPNLCFGQSLEFGLYNGQNKEPIEDAHVFLANASIGTITDSKGACQLKIPNERREELIISHVAYHSILLTPAVYVNLTRGDSIFLEPNGVRLAEIMVVQKRDNKWKKNLRLFKEAFFGVGEEALKCEILNPNVLRFESSKNGFRASAVDLLQIRNNHLGYDIDFLLTELIIEANGSRRYHGYANFKDRLAENKGKRILKNRENAFIASPRHFFLSLINQTVKSYYELRMASHTGEAFKTIIPLSGDEIITLDSLTGNYRVSFSEFLEAKSLKFKKVVDASINVQLSNLEKSKFYDSQSGKKVVSKPMVSQLYKISPHLIVNPHGNIVNQKDVHEYGYWATLRMAMTLPLDYKSTAFPAMTNYKKKEPAIAEVIEPTEKKTNTQIERFKKLLSDDKKEQWAVIDFLSENWQNAYVPPLLDLMLVSDDMDLKEAISNLLVNKTNQSQMKNYYEGLRKLWEEDPIYDNDYSDLKALFYQKIDSKFQQYFLGQQPTAKIGLDEIVWGGVKQDGIPPLRFPESIDAAQADYLHADDVVFGLYINGDARAYPKRILAWHEFFVDTIGGVDIAGVYCTLCGTVMGYDRTFDGVRHDLGTSGFLYRSNKLMYDKATSSLWSTIYGTPVLGPLVAQNIELQSYPLITTTWGNWRTTHPDTKVLSLNTGHSRNYAEGEAYKKYFSTEDLMFPVPILDARLKNKDEVMIVKTDDYKNNPLAVSINYLKKKKWLQDNIGETPIIIVADAQGSARAYLRKNIQFKNYKNGILTDTSDTIWQITEEALLHPSGTTLERLPSFNIFWFAWINVYPETRLKS